MESHETTMQRFSAFWAVMGLIALAAVAGFATRWLGRPTEEIDYQAETKRTAILHANHAEQAKEVQALGLNWQDPQGGHLPLITVPDELIKKTLPAVAARKAAPTTIKTPEAQAKAAASGKHDPVESEFLKK